jgi:hypothetical protein
MTVIVALLLSASALSILAVAILTLRADRLARGPRVIVCPESRTTEAVEVNAARLAWGSLVHEGELTLSSCSRWPERRDCGQECLRQVKAAPDGCLVRERLSHWYRGKSCAICGKPFDEIGWLDHRPALVTVGREIVAWSEVDPRHLPETLATHFPICWDCDVAETFRRRFPDRVLDDPRPAVTRRSA